MNKEVVEHYGWIIVVLVVGLTMIMMATPLGNYIYASVRLDAVDALIESKEQHTVSTEVGDMTTSHTITYNLNGGSWSGNYITSYIEGKSTIMPTNVVPPNEHQEFAGWKDSSGNIIEKIPETRTTNVSVTAQWIGKQYTISYNTNGGTITTTNPISYMTYRYKGNAITLPTATKTGYTFDGWFIDSALTNKITTFNTNAYSEDVILYAKWIKN